MKSEGAPPVAPSAPEVERRRAFDRRSGLERRRGRPPLSAGPSVVLSVRIPARLVDRLCAAAGRRRVTPSDAHRVLLEAALDADERPHFVIRNSEPG